MNIPQNNGYEMVPDDKRHFDCISKDGDTLELSKEKIPNAILSSYTEPRLRALLQNNEITRQQYDEIMFSRESEK